MPAGPGSGPGPDAGPGAAPAAVTPALWALILAIGVFWGLNWPAVKLMLVEVPPWWVRAVGLTGGALILAAIARARGLSLAVPAGERLRLLLAGLLGVAGFNILTAFGQMHMASSRAAIIAFTMPVWASLLARAVLGERLTRPRLGALVLGCGGLALLVAPEMAASGGVPVGAAYVLAAAVSWAAGTVMVKACRFSPPPLVQAIWMVAVSAVLALAGALLLETGPLPDRLTPVACGALVFHILLPMAFCHFAWFTIVSRLPAGTATIGSLVIPVVGVGSSILLLGDPSSWRDGLALVMVVGSVAIGLVRR